MTSGAGRTTLRGRVPGGLLGMVVLVVAVEAWVSRRDFSVANPGPACWRMSGRAATQVRGSEVLCFGTSLSKFGLLPSVIQRRTGRRAYNLAVFSGPMPCSYFLLKRALEAGVRPVALLIDCQDGSIERTRRYERSAELAVNLPCWPELLGLRECLDLSWSARDASFCAAVLLAQVLPSYHARFEVRDQILKSLQGRSETRCLALPSFQRIWDLNRGANVIPEAPTIKGQEEGQDAVTTSHARIVSFCGDRCARNKLGITYARRFLDLAAARGIPVFWLLPPISPESQADFDRSGQTDYFTRMARMAQAYSRRVVVIDARHSGYGPRAFHDKVHLNRRGAVTFTTDVATIVGRYLADPSSVARWVELPAYRDLLAGVPVEERTGSQVVLTARKARR